MVAKVEARDQQFQNFNQACSETQECFETARMDLPPKAIPSDKGLQELGFPIAKISEADSASHSSNAHKTSDSQSDSSELREKPTLAQLQERLSKLLPSLLQSSSVQIDDSQNLSLQQMEYETSRGEFGPATKSAYKLLVDSLQNNLIPNLSKQLSEIGLIDKSSVQLEQAMQLNINTDQPPGKDDLDLLDSTINWAVSAQLIVDAANNEKLAVDVNQFNLPKSWIEGLSGDDEVLSAQIRDWIKTSVQAKVQTKIIDELSKIPGGQRFKNTLPPGTQIERNGKGEITKIDLGLPNADKLHNAESQKRLADLQAWVSQQSKILAPIVKQLEQLQSNPERAIFWGDQEFASIKGRFDKNGSLLGLAGEKAAARPGEALQDVNLIESRFDVKQEGERIIVNQNIQAQSVPWWGYQNMIGVDDVGNRINVQHEFKKGDLVVVPNANGFSLIAAEDLSSYATTQKAWHYGEKTGMLALDIGLTLTGWELVRGGVAAAQIGKGALVAAMRVGTEVAATEGSKAAGRVMTWQLVSGSTRLAVGLGGIINNAGAREYAVGDYANSARNVYFLASAVSPWVPSKLQALTRRTVLGTDGAALLANGGVLNALESGNFFSRANQLIEKINIVPVTGITFMNTYQVFDWYQARQREQLKYNQQVIDHSRLLKR